VDLLRVPRETVSPPPHNLRYEGHHCHAAESFPGQQFLRTPMTTLQDKPQVRPQVLLPMGGATVLR